MARFGMVVAFFATALLVAAVDPECSEHGTIVDGQCICSQPVPTQEQTGWIGGSCSHEVHLLPPDASEASASLTNGTVCWFTSLSGAPHPPHYFAASVTLAADSTGSVKLYGMLAGDPAAPVTGPPTIYPKMPPGCGHWDALATVTPGTHAHAVMLLEGNAVQVVQGQGLYLCASNPQDAPPVTFTVRAAGHSCPLTLYDTGFVSICSSTPEDVRYASDDCPAGTCSCTGQYAKPDAPVDADLGFGSCSAVVNTLVNDTARAGLLVAEVVAHAPGTWHQFNISVSPEHKTLYVFLVASANTTSYVAAYLRPLQPAGRGIGQNVARSRFGDSIGDLALGVQLRAPTLTPGLWYVGVSVWGTQDVSYSLRVRRGACPGAREDCSGRGTCDATVGRCACQAGATGADCANEAGELVLGTAVTQPPREAYTADIYSLGGLSDMSITVALQLNVSFTSMRPLPTWVSARPSLLVSPMAQGAALPDLNPDSAAYKLALPEVNATYQLVLDFAQVGSGYLAVALWNPLSAPYHLGYTITPSLVGRCLDDCSGSHGTCGSNGRCTCLPNWAGASCSVDLAGLGNATEVCVPGSRLPMRKDELHATCWEPCNADTGSFDPSSCADWTCDALGPEGKPQRRAGAASACVTDLCWPGGGAVTLPDESGSFVCDRACVCPEDGSACALDAGCTPNSTRCLNGLILAKGTDGSEQCVQGQSGACEEGSLRLAIPLLGGAAYAVCVCQPLLALPTNQVVSVVKEGTSCEYTSPSAAEAAAGGGAVPATGGGAGLVVCLAGYQVEGAHEDGLVLSDGRTLTSGGKCQVIVIPKRGTSAGGVAFWCFFSILLAAVAVVGGRHGLEWYEARRWDLGEESSGWTGYVRLGVDRLLQRRQVASGDSNNERW